MCNGSSTRQSEGGAIAILHPSSQSSTINQLNLKLLIKNSQDSLNTTISFQDLISNDIDIETNEELNDYNLVIHQLGDLSQSSTPATSESSVYLWSFSKIDIFTQTELSDRLDLGVGGNGIIGRKISLMNGFTNVSVAEGIIGWN